MKLSTTIIFLGLCFVVVAVFLKLKPLEKMTPTTVSPQLQSLSPESPSGLFVLRDGDQIDWIQIQNAEKKATLTLQYKEDGWWLKYPVKYPADQALVLGLVNAIKLSTKVSRLRPERGWEEYGLEQPAMKVGVETKLGEQRRYLMLGDESPVGDNLYAKWDDESEYFLLNKNFKAAFDRSVYSLRLKKIFRTDLSNIEKILIQKNADSYELKLYERDWFWIEPVPILGEKVENQHLNAIFSQLQQLFVKDFMDEKASDEDRDLGFARYGDSVKIMTRDQGEEELILGAVIPEKDAIYAKRVGDDTLFIISKTKLENFVEQFRYMSEYYQTAQQPIAGAV